MQGKFVTGLPLIASERDPQPTLEGAFGKFRAKIGRRRRRRGLHQDYQTESTPTLVRNTKRMLGERDED